MKYKSILFLPGYFKAQVWNCKPLDHSTALRDEGMQHLGFLYRYEWSPACESGLSHSQTRNSISHPGHKKAAGPQTQPDHRHRAGSLSGEALQHVRTVLRSGHQRPMLCLGTSH